MCLLSQTHTQFSAGHQSLTDDTNNTTSIHSTEQTDKKTQHANIYLCDFDNNGVNIVMCSQHNY